MKITIEGSDDECREAVFVLALGYEERLCQSSRHLRGETMTREEYLRRHATTAREGGGAT